jgi:arylsulfatase A-like enzyme
MKINGLFNRSSWLLILCLLQFRIDAQKAPNIVMIVADDMGYGDLGCYGSKTISTPNLDKMAANGIRFTQAYAAAPVCTPSRTAFMTGRYPASTTVGLYEPLDWTPGDSLVGLTSATPSLPAMLKESGYTTHLTGKWHLGFSAASSPMVNGFDSFFGFNGGGIDYVSHTDPNGKPDLYSNKEPVKLEGYMTHLLANDAVGFLYKKHQRPFFLSVQFNAPHWPWQAPGSAVYLQDDKAWKENGSPEKYAAMVASMDSAIGRIMQTLQATGLAKNTIVVFSSDNGGERLSDNGGFRERKMQLWEGGIRVPAIVCWPGKIPANKVIDAPITQMDFTATFLALAGAHSHPDFPLDGMDISPWLFSGKAPDISRTFYWRVSQRRQQKAIREGQWKYLQTETGDFLFDLASDPFERNSLKVAFPQKLQDMKAKLAAWEKEMLPPLSQ